MTHSLVRSLSTAVAVLAATTRCARAQPDTAAALESLDARVAVLPAALYTAQANLQEVSDSTKSTIATGVLIETLGELLGDQAVSGDRIAVLLDAPETAGIRGDQACNVIVACARAVAREVGAPWVVMTKISKTSNLIWLFTGQLIQTSTGKIILDDSTELKGEPGRMVRAGTRIFAQRVARTVRNGGTTTTFPTTK
jgi:hypothetical protein